MAITISECEKAIAAMSTAEEISFLASLGHHLTVVARGTYEFQAPGVKDAHSLRAFNELHHRLYAQLRSLAGNGQRNLDAKDITAWLVGDNQSSGFQVVCLWAFEQALQGVRGDV